MIFGFKWGGREGGREGGNEWAWVGLGWQLRRRERDKLTGVLVVAERERHEWSKPRREYTGVGSQRKR